MFIGNEDPLLYQPQEFLVSFLFCLVVAVVFVFFMFLFCVFVCVQMKSLICAEIIRAIQYTVSEHTSRVCPLALA